MTRTFKTSVTFKCESKVQADKLFSEMKSISYKSDSVHGWATNYPNITNKYNNILGELGFIEEERGILANSEEEFLALAAMTEGDEYYKGEWVMCLTSNSGEFTKGKLYQLRESSNAILRVVIDDKGSVTNGWCKEHFRKAPVEEIINHFSANKNQSNILNNNIMKQLPEQYTVKCNNLAEVNEVMLSVYGKKDYATHNFGFVLIKSEFDGAHLYTLSHNYSEIQFPEWKKLFKNNEKKIIGYNLIKPEYEQAALRLINQDTFGRKLGEKADVTIKENIEKLREAGVLDLWFEAVYENEFKVGEHIFFERVIEDRSTIGTIAIVTKFIKESHADTHWLSYKNLTTGYEGGFRVEAYEGYFRKATPEEIEASKIKLPEINGYKGKYENGMLTYGNSCAKFSPAFFENLNDTLNYANTTNKERGGNREIVSVKLGSGVEITLEQINQIVDFLNKQK